MPTKHDNSAAKLISDLTLSHAKLIAMKADLEEIQRLNLFTGVDNIDAEQIATVDAWILDLRAQLKYND